MGLSGAARARTRVAAGLSRHSDEETAARRARADRTKNAIAAELAALKVHLGCADCGYRAHAEALDFDHRPGTVKVAGVTRMLSERRPRSVVMAEIEKCEVVCANCHRVRTATRRIASDDAKAPPPQ